MRVILTLLIILSLGFSLPVYADKNNDDKDKSEEIKPIKGPNYILVDKTQLKFPAKVRPSSEDCAQMAIPYDVEGMLVSLLQVALDERLKDMKWVFKHPGQKKLDQDKDAKFISLSLISLQPKLVFASKDLAFGPYAVVTAEAALTVETAEGEILSETLYQMAQLNHRFIGFCQGGGEALEMTTAGVILYLLDEMHDYLENPDDIEEQAHAEISE